MKLKTLSLMLSIAVVGCSQAPESANQNASTQSPTSDHATQNKAVATASHVQANAKLAQNALTMMFDKLDASLVDSYYADGYIQHSPSIKDGKVGLKDAIAGMKQGNVTIEREIARVIAENDLVFIQSRVSFGGGQPQIVGDLFRMENGKIKEHWDVMQAEVPKAQTKNGNSMIDGGGDTSKVMTQAQLTRNKQAVTDFIHKGFAQGDKKTLASLFGDEYIQHNPDVPNGKEAVLGFVTDGQGFPAAIKRIVAQGDLVAVLVEYGKAGTEFHNGIVDIFRLDDNGKIVEHWDMGGAIPPAKDFAHDNGFF